MKKNTKIGGGMIAWFMAIIGFAVGHNQILDTFGVGFSMLFVCFLAIIGMAVLTAPEEEEA